MQYDMPQPFSEYSGLPSVVQLGLTKPVQALDPLTTAPNNHAQKIHPWPSFFGISLKENPPSHSPITWLKLGELLMPSSSIRYPSRSSSAVVGKVRLFGSLSAALA
ncbi:hypothetical protein TNCV_4042521 [Trichonephila clavipes]|nr:hypothetical protein TNCV_4042521 [Trichonephila clavipes]